MAENGILDYQGMNQAIYRGATSNIVVDTQSMSIEIGAGNTSHTSNLHFECNHDANVASIKLNSNVVTEFPRSKKLIKYPRVAMTQNDESGTSGYVASASSSTLDPYKAFDNVLYTSYWEPNYLTNAYPNADGAYTGGTGTVYSTNGYTGEYLQIQLPVKIKLYEYSLTNRTGSSLGGRQPKNAKIFASNDGSTWHDIHTHYDNAGTYHVTNGETRSFQLDNITETYYKYYRLAVNSIIEGGVTDSPNISDWSLYGIPEHDPEAHGTDVVVKSVPNVPNTDWLEVYYEGKNYTSGNTVQDETANNRNGTLDGVTYDSVSESFTFVSGNKITAGPMTSFPSGTNYTASMWFKVSEIVASQKLLFHFGHGSAGESFGLNIQNGNIGQYLWGGSTKYTVDNLYTANEWVHAVGTINGSTAEVYVNGHLRLSWAQDITTTIPTNPYLSLGIHFTGEQSSFYTSGFFTGSIANFRLFNRALTSDEIYQLYAYQKEYFGHGDLSMTLKAGRLGIGTSEPRAALDVRGDIYGGCPVLFKANIETPGNTTLSSSSSTPVIWNRVSWNKGGGYDSSNGKFTAPIDGYYSFNHWAMSQGNDDIIFKYMVNGAASNDLNPIRNEPYQTPTGNHTQNSGTTTFKLRKGDYVELFLSGGSMFVSGTGSAMYNSYEGYYLSSW